MMTPAILLALMLQGLAFGLCPGAQQATATSSAQVHLDRARKLIASNKLQPGLEELGRGLRLAPNHPDFWSQVRALPGKPEGYRLQVDEELGSEVRYFPDLDTVMIRIPAGTSTVGRDGVDALDEESPARRVHLEAFWIDMFEVTNRRYERFVRATGHRPPRSWPGPTPPAARLDHPVGGVSWEDARAFAAFSRARLPSELEWERAARHPAGGAYPWGDAPLDRTRANADNRQSGALLPVGSLPAGASVWGCLDMAGNVWEWCRDTYAPWRYRGMSDEPSPLTRDQPSQISKVPDGPLKCRRGGSWWDAADFCRVSYRSFAPARQALLLYGFRLARDAE